MKYSKFLVSTLVAAAAMTVPAFADGDANTILINFGSSYGTGASSISGTWNDTTDGSGSSDSLVFSDGSLDASAVSWTSSGLWTYSTSVTDGVLKGYLDDNGSDVSINVAHGFLLSDVTIYCATDNGSAFTAKRVNGTYYTYADGATIEGNDTWGTTLQGSIAEGVNALTISGVSGNISIYSVRDTGANARGCIAGLKITNAYTGSKTAVSLSGTEQTWTDSAIGSADWTNSTADAGTYAAFDLSADTSVNVTGTAITTDAITASGAGTLTLSGGAISLIGPGVVRTDSDSAAIAVSNSLTFNSYGVVNGNVSFNEGSSVTFVSGGIISGNVSFGENSSVTVSSGTLDISSVSSIPTNLAVHVNEGASVAFAFPSNISADDTKFSAANITGAGTVVLSMTTDYGNKFSIDSDSFTGTAYVSSGNFTINDAKFGSELKLADGVNLQLTGGSTVEFAKKLTLEGTSQLHQNSSATLTFTENSVVSGSGTYARKGGGTLTFNGTVDLGGFTQDVNATTNFAGSSTKIGTMTLSGTGTSAINFTGTTAAEVGTLNITAGTLTLSGKVNVSGTLSAQNNGTSFTIASGSVVSAEKFYGSAGADTYSMTTTINGVFNVSGSTNDASPNFAAFLMANAGGRNTITVGDGGVLNLANAGVSNRDGTGVLNIASGGEANFGKGLYVLTNNETWGAATVNLTGGRLNVGADASGVGISTDGKSNVSVNLTTGTVGALSDSWSSALAFSLGGDVVFDTAKKQISTDGNATDTGTAAAIVLSGVLSDASDVSGKIVKDGAGTLTLSGANTFTGGVEISAGTLTAGNGNALGTGTTKLSGGQLSIASGVTLNLSALTIALGDAYADAAAIVGDGSLTLADAATITLTKADEVAIAFSVDEATKSYQIFDSSLAGDFSTDSFSLGEGWEGWQISSYDSSTGVLTLSIPEPSAFGLLAGAGALALVAVRRRRRSRAK